MKRYSWFPSWFLSKLALILTVSYQTLPYTSKELETTIRNSHDCKLTYSRETDRNETTREFNSSPNGHLHIIPRGINWYLKTKQELKSHDRSDEPTSDHVSWLHRRGYKRTTHRVPTANITPTATLRRFEIFKLRMKIIGRISRRKSWAIALPLLAKAKALISKHLPLTSRSQNLGTGQHENTVDKKIAKFEETM